jgi:hypothetical protein
MPDELVARVGPDVVEPLPIRALRGPGSSRTN